MKIEYKSYLKSTLPVLMLFFTLIVSSQSLAQISVVVSSKSNHNVSDADIKNIYTGNLFTWADGAKITVVDQGNSSVGAEFYDKFIGQSAGKLRLKWTKLVLSGQTNAPVKSDTDDDVKKAVASNMNAIGYISSKSLDDTVKEIYRIE